MPGPIIDMSPDGDFRAPSGTPFSAKILRIAIMVAVLGSALALAAFALWVALLLIPVVLGAMAVAWIAWRWRMWQVAARYSAASGSAVRKPAASANNV